MQRFLRASLYLIARSDRSLHQLQRPLLRRYSPVFFAQSRGMAMETNHKAPLRVVSLLPSATDMLCFVADPSWLVGRSHECDYPAEVTNLPALTAARTKFENSRQMHEAVNESLGQGRSLYTLDVPLLESLKPDVVLTQSLCEVCSVELGQVERACSRMANPPKVVSFNPSSMDHVLQDMLRLGQELGIERQAEEKVKGLQQRIQRVKDFVATRDTSTKPKVAFLEWTDPIFCGGHWTPEAIALAGGSHPLNEAVIGEGAQPSRAFEDADVAALDPDWVIVCPCGFDIPTTLQEMDTLEVKPWWRQLRAIKEGRVVVADGNQMFNRPGPRLVDALEFLAGLLHGKPEIIPADFPWQEYTLPPLKAPAAAGNDVDRPASLPSEVAWNPGNAAPSVTPEVEEAHMAALRHGDKMYSDPATGYMVFTEIAQLRRGMCCGSRCRHCPYGHYRVTKPQLGGRCNRITVPVLLQPPKPRAGVQQNGSARHLQLLESLDGLQQAVVYVCVVDAKQDQQHVLLAGQVVELGEAMNAALAAGAQLLVLPSQDASCVEVQWLDVAERVLASGVAWL